MNHPSGALTAQIPRKRKEREDLFLPSLNSKGKQVQIYGPPSPSSHPNTTSSKPKPKPVDPALSNRLLAGYMAHEFLTQGTLLGQKFDPARAQAVPMSAEPKKKPPPRKSYAEVASLLKTDGAQISGVVNPTQLSRWIQM